MTSAKGGWRGWKENPPEESAVGGQAEMGLSDTKADVLDDRLSIVWAREWWRRWGTWGFEDLFGMGRSEEGIIAQ